jgi:phage tail sheath protein FI
MPFQLSPGVAVVEKDFTSIVPAVSSSIGAFAGAFPWGPTLEPVTVSSENDLVRRFGKPNDSNFNSFFTAANFLSYTNNLLLVRADTGALNAVGVKTGGISSFTVGTAGSGYTSTAAAPAVTIGAPNDAGGIQAVGTAVLSGGAITAVAVSSGGTGYSGTPTVVITSPSGGTGATFSVTVVSNVITAVTVLTGGTGYKGTVTASFTGGGGSGASAGTVTVASSSITGVTVATAGTGYTSAPSVTIAAPPSGVTAVATSTVTTAGLKIINGETYNTSFINGAGVVGAFAAKYPGAAGNSLLVSMADSATFAAWAYKAEFDSAPNTSTYAAAENPSSPTTPVDELHIIVIDEDGVFSGTPGTVLEKFAFVSKASDAKKSDGTNNYYKNVVNSRSEYIWWMDHPTTVTGTTNWGSVAAGATFKALTSALTYSLDGGTDDFAVTDGELQTAYALFNNAELYDISLVLAGKASAATATYIINNVCETRLDCVAFISPQDISSGDPIIGSTSTQATAIVAYRDALPSTSYAVMDSGYKYQYDRYSDVYRFVPLNGDVGGLCARTDYTNDPWFSPGGLNRGQIKNVVRLAFNPNKTSRDTLYKKGVNPVVTFPGEGTVLFGDKTLLAKPSAFDRINVRRLFIVMEKAIATAAKFQLFEFNDGFTRAQFKNLVEPFLRDVQGRRGITDFVVKCDESNNTGEVIDRNEFVADIFVKPNRSINFITLNFVAARSAINFSEIGA